MIELTSRELAILSDNYDHILSIDHLTLCNILEKGLFILNKYVYFSGVITTSDSHFPLTISLLIRAISVISEEKAIKL